MSKAKLSSLSLPTLHELVDLFGHRCLIEDPVHEQPVVVLDEALGGRDVLRRIAGVVPVQHRHHVAAGLPLLDGVREGTLRDDIPIAVRGARPRARVRLELALTEPVVWARLEPLERGDFRAHDRAPTRW